MFLRDWDDVGPNQSEDWAQPPVRAEEINCDKPNRSRASQLQQDRVEAIDVIRY
jgi:hypothetical protein